MEPYYADEHMVIYHGDCRDILPHVEADLMVADPPYGETSLEWDTWPEGWLTATHTRSLWCFGSLRMFLDRASEFTAAGWKLSQDVVWEKHNGTGFATDRFRRVHEIITHWYRGAWSDTHHETPRMPAEFDAKGRTTSKKRDDRFAHTGAILGKTYVDDGTRLARSVIRCPSVRRGYHRSQKPVEVVRRLIEYACPPGGVVVDPFMGSGTTLHAARDLHRKTVGIEVDERLCDIAVQRLRQERLDPRHWTEIEPKDAVDIVLPRDDIVGPVNEMGEPCPWPWDPQQLVGAPLGQYHCEFCGGMVVAGMPHIDYRERGAVT